MFDRTKYVIDQTIRDVKKFGEIFNIVTQLSYIAYLIYALIAQTGHWIVNTVLLVLSVGFFIFSLIANGYLKKHSKTEQKSMRKLMYKIKRIYNHSKLIVKLFPLGVSLYSVYLTSGNVNPFTLITLVFMLVGWVLQIITEFLVYVFNKKKNLIVEAFKADVDSILAPAKTVGNFFKKITGQETQTAPPPTKKMQKIEEKLKNIKENKKREKLEKQAEKERQRQESVEEKKRFFRSVKKEKELMRSAQKPQTDAIDTQDETEESDGQV